MKHKITHFGPEIAYFCKDCDKVVKADKVGRKFVYRCKECGTKNVAFGTLKSLENFYRVEEKEKKKAQAARRKEAKEGGAKKKV